MAVSTRYKSNVNGTLTYTDGTTPTAVTLTSSFERGDFKLSGLRPDLNEVNPIRTRGKHKGLVFGDRVYPSVSFSCWTTQFTEGSAPGTDADFLLFRGAYSANVSTSGDGGPKTLHLGYTMEGTDFGDAADHSFELEDVHPDTVDWEESPEGNFLAFSGTVYGDITGDLAVTEIA